MLHPFASVGRWFGWVFALCSAGVAQASNVQLHSLAVESAQYLRVELSWENSWLSGPGEAPGNHDAVWVFVKIRENGGQWRHLDLSAQAGSHSPGPGFEVQAVSDGKGIFVKRNQPGEGATGLIALRIALLTPLAAGFADLEASAIEMVYVPEGAFFIGDGASFHHFRESQSGNPYQVSGEQALAAGVVSAGTEAGFLPALPAGFPKGFAGFYAMKYEITQGQYRDFLNQLSFSQQQARTHSAPNSAVGTPALALSAFQTNRNGLVVAQPGTATGTPAVYACNANGNSLFNEPEDGEHRACNFLSWADLLAYLDWAALRPMTEWEFEKACRGPEVPVPGGFAWGTAFAVDANTLTADGTASESVSETATSTAGLASHGYAGPQGPLRNGFGGSPNSDRLQAGGSYFGLWELSGNVWELTVAANADGAGFSGAHGDGSPAPDGSADAGGWPLTSGGIHRGGAHNSGIVAEFRDLAVSDRFYYNLHPAIRRNSTGGRGVRTYPN